MKIEYLQLIADFFLTAFAVFGGAYLAFRFEARGNKEREKSENIEAANRALYTIYNMWNVLKQYHRDALKPLEGRPDRWLNIPATGPRRPRVSSFDIRDLSFLLQAGRSETFATVLHEEQRFDHFMLLLDFRASIVMNQVFPRLERAGLSPQSAVAADAVLAALGSSIVHQLQHLESRIVGSCDRTLTSLRSAFDRLFRTMKELYPDEEIVTVDFDANPDGEDRAAA